MWPLPSGFRDDSVDLPERWRAEIPGVVAHEVMVCSATNSVYVSDGWHVPSPSSSVYRLDLRTGERLAARRTRHQGVGAFAMACGSVWVATDTRLFELDPHTLDVRREWNERLVRYAQQLLPIEDHMVMANWLAPTVGIFNPATGETRRVRATPQPVLFAEGDELKIAGGLDGSIATLDVEHGTLHKRIDAPPITAVAATGSGVWGVLGGRKIGGRRQDQVSTRRPSNRLRRLSDGAETRLRSRCELISGTSESDELWCVIGDGDRLEFVDASTGDSVARFRLPGAVASVDPASRLALSTVRSPVSSTSMDDVPITEFVACQVPPPGVS